jgi:hypothetical protein
MKLLISLILMVVLLSSLVEAQDCINYEDYMHWAAGMNTYQARGVAISGSFAYVADGSSGGLQVIDITNPASLQFVVGLNTPGSARGVAISGSYAYVADALSGLQVLDISNPTGPQFVGGMDTPGFAWCVAISGGYAYVADGGSGLQVLPTQCGDASGIDENYLDPELTDTPQPLARLSVYPNPFNPRTTISFTIDHSQNVDLCIFDMTGKRIAVLADRVFQAGTYSMDWRGKDLQSRDVASGVYLLRMSTEERVTSEKMMLIR